jgi:hypothetical protein
MPRNLSLGPIATCVYLALTGLLLAAQTAGTETANPPATEAILSQPSPPMCVGRT